MFIDHGGRGRGMRRIGLFPARPSAVPSAQGRRLDRGWSAAGGHFGPVSYDFTRHPGFPPIGVAFTSLEPIATAVIRSGRGAAVFSAALAVLPSSVSSRSDVLLAFQTAPFARSGPDRRPDRAELWVDNRFSGH